MPHIRPQIIHLAAQKWMRLPGVVLVGEGTRRLRGEDTGVPCITVGVMRKLSPADIPAEFLIPRSFSGCLTDVVQTGELFSVPFGGALDSGQNTGRHRPIHPGVSIGHYKITAGTIGLILADGDEPPLLVSNNHVLAASNAASVGDVVLQPGPADGGMNPDDAAGALERFVRIRFDGEAQRGGWLRWLCELLRLCRPPEPNRVDAAAARVGHVFAEHDIPGIGYPSGVIAPEVGLRVRKLGRTTALTHGRITIVNATARVSYGLGRTATFVDVAGAEPIGLPGFPRL